MCAVTARLRRGQVTKRVTSCAWMVAAVLSECAIVNSTQLTPCFCCWSASAAAAVGTCRYLFVRCDNAPAPWTSDETGDKLRMDVPDLAAKEIKQAQGQVFAMGDKPFW